MSKEIANQDDNKWLSFLGIIELEDGTDDDLLFYLTLLLGVAKKNEF